MDLTTQDNQPFSFQASADSKINRLSERIFCRVWLLQCEEKAEQRNTWIYLPQIL